MLSRKILYLLIHIEREIVAIIYFTGIEAFYQAHEAVLVRLSDGKSTI